MPPTAQDRLHDIIESVSSIEKIIQGKSLEQFTSDVVSRMATERLPEIVCEASRRLPGELRQSDSTIDWQRMVDFGNVLRHAYHAIRVDIILDVVQNDLPALKSFAVRNIERR